MNYIVISSFPVAEGFVKLLNVKASYFITIKISLHINIVASEKYLRGILDCSFCRVYKITCS